MSILFLMLFCFVFGLAVVVSQVTNIKRKSRIDLANIFCIVYGATFGILPAIYLFMYEFLQIRIIRILYSQTDLNYLWMWFALAVVGYVVFKAAYKISLASKAAEIKELNLQSDKPSQRDYARLELTGIICLVVGVVSLYLWARAYGGIFELIRVGNAVRSGLYDIVNTLAFFKHPAKVITFVSYIFLFLVKRRYHTVINLIFFSVSLFYSVCFLLAGDGRMTTVTYFVILFLIFTDMFAENINVTRRIFWVLLAFVGAGVLILNLDGITAQIRGDELINSAEESATLLEELSFIIASGQISVRQMMTSGSPNLILHDVLLALFAWVPSSFTPDGLIDIWNYNTSVYRNGATGIGQLPSDFVSTSIYDFGVLGIIILAVIWGFAIKLMDNSRRKLTSPFYKIVYCSLAMSIFRLPEYCLMYDFVLGMFNVFVAAVIWRISALIITENDDRGERNGKIKKRKKINLR